MPTCGSAWKAAVSWRAKGAITSASVSRRTTNAASALLRIHDKPSSAALQSPPSLPRRAGRDGVARLTASQLAGTWSRSSSRRSGRASSSRTSQRVSGS